MMNETKQPNIRYRTNPSWSRLEKRWAFRMALATLEHEPSADCTRPWTEAEARWALQMRLPEAVAELAA